MNAVPFGTLNYLARTGGVDRRNQSGWEPHRFDLAQVRAFGPSRISCSVQSAGDRVHDLPSLPGTCYRYRSNVCYIHSRDRSSDVGSMAGADGSGADRAVAASGGGVA